jgi:hypothetical protein
MEAALQVAQAVCDGIAEGFDSNCELVDTRLLHLNLLQGDLRRGRALEVAAELADFFDEGVWALLGCGYGGQRGHKDKSSHHGAS